MLSSLKLENWFAVAMGIDGDVVVAILLVGGRLRFLLEVTVIHIGVVLLRLMLKKEGV